MNLKEYKQKQKQEDIDRDKKYYKGFTEFEKRVHKIFGEGGTFPLVIGGVCGTFIFSVLSLETNFKEIWAIIPLSLSLVFLILLFIIESYMKYHRLEDRYWDNWKNI